MIDLLQIVWDGIIDQSIVILFSRNLVGARKRLRRKPEPAGLRRLEKLLKERMEPVGIMEALSDTHEWLNWTRHFGPISGNDRKLENPTERYLITTFCYGFDFGPTQTSRSIRGLDRRQVAFVTSAM
jgi:hypothetical protein